MDRHRRQFTFRPRSACVNPLSVVITPACCKAPLFCHSLSRSLSWNS
ncbi:MULTISPECIES: protein YoaL [unclassified Pseudescherichia]